MKSIEDSDGSRFNGVPSGFTGLDEMLNGLQRGELLILAARPSMGKTAFASTSRSRWRSPATRR